jgi:hypothetical protein
MFHELPMWSRIVTVIAIGMSVLVTLVCAFFIVPDLWRAGRAIVDGLLSPGSDGPLERTPDVETVRGGGAADRVPRARARLDAAAALGSDLPRVRGLSERVGRVGPFGVPRSNGNGHPSAAKGFKR